MKILYAGELNSGGFALFRQRALERLGQTVVPLDIRPYRMTNTLLHKVTFRLAAGPHVVRFNRDLLRLAEAERPDVLWADKLLSLWPSTLNKINALGITTLSYMIDNPFGPRRDPGWRLYLKNLPLFDLHVQQRDRSVAEYTRRGAKAAMKVMIGFDPTTHFASATPVTDALRDRDVSFIGTPYDDRHAVLTEASDAGLPVVISGNERAWRRVLRPDAFEKMFRRGELFAEAYREGIWHSKINLSFLTKANQDEYAHKSFEIAGCGGFLLAERCAGHSELFREDEEAVFFSGAEELIAKVRRYLPDEAARNRIAAAGHARAVRDGYDSDSQIRLILSRLEQVMQAKQRAASVGA